MYNNSSCYSFLVHVRKIISRTYVYILSKIDRISLAVLIKVKNNDVS